MIDRIEENKMEKTFNFGKIDLYGTGRRVNLVIVKAELKEKEEGKPVFSASAEIWNSRKTDCICCGQCLDEVAEFVKDKTFQKLYYFWQNYHLNDMHAGTPEQEKAIDVWKQNNVYDYKKACEYLTAINMYEVIYEGKPYKYGHAWMYEPIPENDLAEIKSLLSD
jgi:hypothetical protein